MEDEYQTVSSIKLCSTKRQRQPQNRCQRRRPRQDLLSVEYSCTQSRSSHRLPLLRVLICMCSVLLRLQLSVVDASSSSSLGIPLRITAAMHAYNALRGGGNDAAGPEEGVAQDEEEEQEKEQEQRRKLWPVDNLFRLNDDVKSEAASLINTAVPSEVKELDDPLVEQPLTKTSKKEGSRNNSRGGALTMVKAPKTKTRRFAWLAPLDTSRVAPSSSRLLQDEEDQIEREPDVAAATVAATANATVSDNATATDTKIASAEMTSFNQIWWGNVWDQQLPDDDEQVEEETANDLFSEKVWEEPESSTVQEPELKRPSGRKAKRKASREASAADAKFKEDTEVSREVSAADAKFIQNTEASREASATDTKSKQDAEAPPAVEKDMIESNIDDGSIAENTTRMEEETQEGAHIRPTLSITSQPIHTTDTTRSPAGDVSPSPFVSSGYWGSIDKMLTMGYADSHPAWRVSRQLRTVRKATARVTGLHGALSGKGRTQNQTLQSIDDAQMGSVRRRLAAIHRARKNVELLSDTAATTKNTKRRGFLRRKRVVVETEYSFVLQNNKNEESEERLRRERVQEIDRNIVEAQLRLRELACEKDVLQRRPNPLWNYTTDSSKSQNAGPESNSIGASRHFNFPPTDLVEDYLDVLFLSGRLIKLNHTDLWKNGGMDADDDDYEDDELALFSDGDSDPNRKRRNGNGQSGNWLLRHGIGEKIGESAETAAYKAVCRGMMGVLAKSLSAIHGVNILTYSDIRLFMEQAPDLPPLAAGIIPGSGMNTDYAHDALSDAMRRGAKKNKKKQRYRTSDDAFIQRDAVVETLLSHCQISAPLLKHFPLAWQRAMLGNLITLITSVISDFFEGLQFQILGHQLSFSFKPITEDDMIRHLGMVGDGFNRQKAKPEEFEAAVRATAEDMSENLKFLDRWHERALGSGMLRMQIATLIARLVLTLIDDVLGGARMDLWAAHAGGPRLVAGLEYRTTPQHIDGR